MSVGYRDLLAAVGAKVGTDSYLRSTVSLTFGEAYGLTGAAPLSSTVSLTTSANGDFGGTPGILTGASTVTFTPSGTLLGLGVITGASTLTFAFTPTLSGRIGFFGVPGFWATGAGYPSPQALATTIPLTTTVSAVFDANGPLVSNIDLTFGVQGRQPPGFQSLFWGNGLSIGVDGGMMQGAVSFAFSGTGTFASSEGFFQNVAVTSTFTVSTEFEFSIRKYQGQISSPLMRPGKGPWNPGLYKRRRNNVAARALGEVSGTVPLTCSVFGSFSGSEGALVGATTASFTVVGTADEAGALVSSVPMLFTPAGVLAGDGALVGDVQLATDVTATISDPGSMAVNSTAAFSVVGLMEGAGALQGAIDVRFSVAGGFPNVWRPVYTGHGTQWRVIRTR